MRSVTCSMGVSLDGYIVGPDGDFGWTAPDEEVFRFVTDEIREIGVHLLGRRLYETMLYWETIFTGRKRRPSRTCRWIVEDPGPSTSSWLARWPSSTNITRPSGVSAEATVDQSSRRDSLALASGGRGGGSCRRQAIRSRITTGDRFPRTTKVRQSGMVRSSSGGRTWTG
jgi:hypothetical protein